MPTLSTRLNITLPIVIDALSTILRLLGEELKAAS